MRAHGVEVAVDVVQLAVLHVAHVQLVLGHRHLGPVEHGRLVHVVPREHVLQVGFITVTWDWRIGMLVYIQSQFL